MYYCEDRSLKDNNVIDIDVDDMIFGEDIEVTVSNR